MNRKQRIFTFLEEICKKDSSGLTTSFIAEKLNISRANVSSELNKLVKENIISKSFGRPVKYFTKPKDNNTIVVEQIPDPFSFLIGCNSSLKNAVKQAKAAIMYPPFGLHTLITGNTGVGKSFFAKLMYNYAVTQKSIKNTLPFIVFNCADYANNPQLLISHIFGYTKGAFTGASNDKLGLIAEANGGILFLDEIHRLPPEGQEMIFYFMDTGSYGLLGETQRKRKSQVLLIGATTEDPNSTLLSTFLRRIPIKIDLPNLDQRTPEELVELLNFIFENESQRIKHPIRVDDNSAKAILGASFNGNVGKLKSNIQTVCALSLIEHGIKENVLTIQFDMLPSEVKSGLVNFRRDKEYQIRLNKILAQGIFVDYDKKNQINTEIYNNSYCYPIQLYNFIDNKLQLMLDNQFSELEINHFIVNEVNQYVNLSSYIVQDHGIDKKIVNFCQQIKSELELQLNSLFSSGFIISLGYHIENIFKNNHLLPKREWLKKYNISSLDTYDAALFIKKRLESTFHVKIDHDEVTYLAILTSSLKINQDQNSLHIIVAAHGESIATEMVNIAKELLSENNITAIDMPLNIQPNQAILEIKKAITTVSHLQGILLLVDMGSLKQAESVIASDFDIPIRTLDMVSTPLVIEALRRSVIVNVKLDELYYSLKHFNGYGETIDYQPLFTTDKPYAILAICSSGEGIAQKLKKFLMMTLEKNNRKDIFVLNVSVDYIMNNKTNIIMEYNLLATIGVIDPKLKVPHLFLNELLSYKGDFVLQSVIGYAQKKETNYQGVQTATTIAEVYLQDFLTYLNPKKILPIVTEFIETIKKIRFANTNDPIMPNAYIHISCALERSLKNEIIEYNKQIPFDSDLIDIYRNAASCFQEKLAIRLDDNELFYIIDILENKINHRV